MTAKIIKFPVRPRAPQNVEKPRLRGYVDHRFMAQRAQRDAWHLWWLASDIYSDERRIEIQRRAAVAYRTAREHTAKWLAGWTH